MRARLGLEVADVQGLNLEQFDETFVPKERRTAVFKLLKQFLKNVDAKDMPQWFQSWKDKRHEEMKRKAGIADDKSGGKATAEEAANQSAAEDKKDDDKEDAVVEASDAAEGQFKVGDHVMGVATKHKEKWAQEGEITGVLSNKYKVKMLTGNAIGADHKFLIKDVKAIPSEKPAAKVAKTDAASDAGSMSMSAPPNPRDGESDMLDIVDIEQIWVKKKLE